MKAVNVLVLTGYGLNCDNETAYAFELTGASARQVHINALIAGAVSLSASMASESEATRVPRTS